MPARLGRNTAEKSALENELDLLGNLPKNLKYPSNDKKTELNDALRSHLDEAQPALEDLAVRVKGNVGKPLERVNLDPEPGELNMQLALSRLMVNPEDQHMARTDGKAFQIKYNLSNKQMFTLCRLAVQVGFYENTEDLQEYLDLYAKLSPEVHAMTPDAVARLGLNHPAADKAIIGSCSCSCP